MKEELSSRIQTKKRNISEDNNTNIVYSSEEVKEFMKTIHKELYHNLHEKEEVSNQLNLTDEEEKDHKYYTRYTQYMKEEFNISIINMINYYIIKFNSFAKHYKNEPNFNYKIVDLIKHIFMNEIEVSCFTLLVEIIGINYKRLDHWLCLTILGLYSKKVCGNNNDIDLIINYFSRNNPLFIEEYSSFINDKQIISKINDNTSLKKINKRFIQLSKPMNSYCRKNYINFLGIIDKIINTSQPYVLNKSKRKPAKCKKKRKKKIISNSNSVLKANEDGIFPLSQFDDFMDMKNINNEFEHGNNNYFPNNILDIFNNFEYDNFFNLKFDLPNSDSLSSIVYEI